MVAMDRQQIDVERIAERDAAYTRRTGWRATVRVLGSAFLWTAGTIVVANLVVFFAARLLWGVPGGFEALNPFAIVVTSIGGALVATVGLAVLSRLGRGGRFGRAVFSALAVLFTLASLGGPLQAMSGGMPGMPPADTPTAATMVALHLITGLSLAFLLPRRARRGEA